jgi:protein FRG1
MVKPLSFKGDKKTKKRKHRQDDDESKPTPTDLSAHAQHEEQNTTTEDDHSWVSADVPSDISGPVVIVLPSTPIPTCIACDANGAVFASELENTIDNDPRTAEPHDVRQVWVATRVAGTEGFSFKGHHGRFVPLLLDPFDRMILTCWRFGVDI